MQEIIDISKNFLLNKKSLIFQKTLQTYTEIIDISKNLVKMPRIIDINKSNDVKYQESLTVIKVMTLNTKNH